GLGADSRRWTAGDRLRGGAQDERRVHASGAYAAVSRLRCRQLHAPQHRSPHLARRRRLRGVDGGGCRGDGDLRDGVPGRVDRDPQAGLDRPGRRRRGGAPAQRWCSAL
ncbi:MAG: small multidrug resistance family (SMR) protein, partial [uncultured Nocardioidaceae bacterium]